MHDLLKKNKKKLLAMLGAFLMVSFLYSPANRSTGSQGRHSVIGNIGKTPVYADERSRADKQWRMLEQSYRADLFAGYVHSMYRGQQGQMMFNFLNNQPELKAQVLNQAARQGVPVMALDLLGPSIGRDVREHSELFFLLIKEAESRGIRISDDAAATAAKNEILPVMPSSLNDDAYRDAVRSLLMVQALRDEVTGDAKFSEPQWKQMYGEQFRGVRLNIVEFTVDQFKPLTPAPTTQQVDSVYAEFRNVPADANKPAGDALSFGYQVPNRVKLQYFKIPRDKVMEAAKAAHRDSRDKPDAIPFDLEVKARLQYDQNLEKYVREAPATQPTTVPATRPVLGPFDISATTRPTTGPTTLASATQPTTVAATPPPKPKATTRPFAEVEAEIVDEIVKPEADKLETEVANALGQRLSDDYFTFHRANPTTLPTTLPTVASAIAATTSPTTKPGYDSFEYLEEVAKDIQRRFGILPEVTQIPAWNDAKELALLPGIGLSHTKESEPFDQYAAVRSAPFTGTPEHATDNGLRLWQPSEELTDSTQNAYVFRLTDASPAHAPALADVRARVEEDAKVKAAYAAANETAKKFIDAARRDSFSRAALDDHRSPIQTEAFNIDEILADQEDQHEIKNFQVGPEATKEVARKADELLAQMSPANPKPMAMLPLPALRKILVIQLYSVSMLIPEPNVYRERLSLTGQKEWKAGEMLTGTYFTYDSVAARLGYKKAEDQSKSGS